MTPDRSLDSILNTGSKAKIIKLFALRKDDFRASGRQIAALAGITAPTAHAALKELYRQDVLKRKIIGRQHLYGLNNTSNMVRRILKPMFRKESSLKQEIGNHLTNRARNKNIYIIAGSNGSGKTTFAKKFLPNYTGCLHFVNSDLIARGLSPFSPQIAAMKAGRLVLEQISDLAGKGLDFGFETTLSGKSYINRLRDLKANGYALHLFFLWIPSVKLAVTRIKDRVAAGGHDVPRQDVRRRFHRGTHNFFKFYMPLLDSWILLNNSSTTPGLIAKEKGNQRTVIDKDLFAKISKIVREK
ncbi:MAG: zeta toxin family protein [Omnitrophica bacterium]|nr:zeta toxin family protein [Candidatus Omnitrophota bacterium]